MSYGELPKSLGIFNIDCKEMMFYQYLPIKLPNQVTPIYEQRLSLFDDLIGTICCDFVGSYGLNNYVDSYIYLTAKHLYVSPSKPFNRAGWHSDGFMTEDINYIWCDKYPTIFNTSAFVLPQDDLLSMQSMLEQAKEENNIKYSEYELLRLTQFNIHKVAPVKEVGMRAFLKISFSKDKYDLVGNSHNYLLNYNWEMRKRNSHRNIPQKL